jgi:ethanolamine-phosphate phospho-lyase
VYRGDHRLDDADLNNVTKLTQMGQLYADDVQTIIAENAAKGRKVAAYFAEALQACGGQVIPPPGYFKRVAEYANRLNGE